MTRYLRTIIALTLGFLLPAVTFIAVSRIDTADALQGGPSNYGAIHATCTACGPNDPVIFANRHSDSGTGLVADFQYQGTSVMSISNTGLQLGNSIVGPSQAISSFLRLLPQATQTVTDASVLTPTGSYQPITSTVAATITMNTACTAGNVVVLTNLSSNAIIVDESATFLGSGDMTLGQHDSLSLICNGTGYMELAESDN